LRATPGPVYPSYGKRVAEDGFEEGQPLRVVLADTLGAGTDARIIGAIDLCRGAPMKFELDRGADALHIRPKEGLVEKTIEPDGGAYADLDAGDRSPGLEFVALRAFDEWTERYGSLNIPDEVQGRDSSLTPA
jgi:hypothetical protein